MEKCTNCLIPQESPDGIIDIINGLCDACREHNELAAVLTEDSIRYSDFDYSLS